MRKLLDGWELEKRRLERQESRRAAWAAWARWWKRRAAELKTAAAFLGALGTVGGFIWRAVTWYRTHDVGPAEDQSRSGARMFVDRVDKPKK